MEGLFTADDLKKLSKEQFENEIRGIIPIKSIEKRLDSSPFVHVYVSSIFKCFGYGFLSLFIQLVRVLCVHNICWYK